MPRCRPRLSGCRSTLSSHRPMPLSASARPFQWGDNAAFHAPCRATISARRGSMSMPRWPPAQRLPLDRGAGELPVECAAAQGRRWRAGVQRARRRVAGEPGRRRQARGCARRRRADAGADAAARPALPVRAAQACAPRLHGAEGGRDGRVAAAAGARRAMRRSRASISSGCAPMRSRPPSNAASSTFPEVAAPIAFDRMMAERDPERLLVFCDEAADVQRPGRGARGGAPGTGASRRSRC